MEEIVLWRTANLLITQHGENAGLKAADRHEELRAKGDTEGMAAWRHIIKIINRLEVDKPEDAVLN